MYLFKENKLAKIPVTCKLCLKEVEFEVTNEEYKKIKRFPITKENIHGEPTHRLIVYINKFLEIEDFEIKDILKREDMAYSKELTFQALSEIDLTKDEIDLYIRTTGREALTVGELSILSGKSKDECEIIAKKFVEKGLFKAIIGAKPHYTALPPYPALISQLHNFYEHISDIKKNLPSALTKSVYELESEAEKVKDLDDSKDIMQSLKQDMINQLKMQKEDFTEELAKITRIEDFSKDIGGLEDYAQSFMANKVDQIKNNFESLNVRISDTIKNQIQELKDEFDDIQNVISDNLNKLRLGVIQQTVDQIIERVLSSRLNEIVNNLNVQLSVNKMVMTDELSKTTDSIYKELIDKIQGLIKETVASLEARTGKGDPSKKIIHADISENFNKAIQMAVDKMESISDTFFESIVDIRRIVSDKIVDTLEYTLDDMLKRIKVSEITTREFWEQAKRGTFITMKDIWFIRSIESAKAHINEEISKAKMRILVIAPTLTDLDIKVLLDRPTHVNIRISTMIDLDNPEHKQIINQLDKRQNIDYRNRALKNIWGINRDYEEVVLCVLSETEIADNKIIEIAGIASIIEEHIKLFVPILEDAWMSSRKITTLTLGGTSSFSSGSAKTPDSLVKPSKVEELNIKAVLTAPKTEETPSVAPTQDKVNEVKPISTLRIEEDTKEVEPKELSLTSLADQFDLIAREAGDISGKEIAERLEFFQNDYLTFEGYNSSFKHIIRHAGFLKTVPNKLNSEELKDLRIKMRFWKQKLNL